MRCGRCVTSRTCRAGYTMPVTSAIESINMSLRKAIKSRSSFPTGEP